MTLLVARCDLTSHGIIPQIGLAKTMGQAGDALAVGRYAEDGAGEPSDCAACLPWLAYEKAAVLFHLDGRGEFAGLGGLVDLGTKQLSCFSTTTMGR